MFLWSSPTLFANAALVVTVLKLFFGQTSFCVCSQDVRQAAVGELPIYEYIYKVRGVVPFKT